MATQTIEFRSPPTQTTTAKLFAVGSDTQVASVTATEATNRKGTYSAAYADVAAGEYELIAFVGAVPVARWFVTLTLTTATFQVYDKAKTELIAANAVNASALATDAVTEIQSGLATSGALAAAKTILDKVDTGLVVDGAVYQFTANMLELGAGGSSDWTANERTAIRSILGVPASGTTPADPTVGILDTTRDLVVSYIAAALATVNGTSGTIVGFPTTLNMGDSYTDEANASIHVFIRDSLDAPILAVGSFNFTDPEFAPEVTITQSGSTGRVKAVVTYVDPGNPESYLKIEIPSSQTRRASPGAATIQCLLKWVDVDGKVLCQKTLAQQAVTWNEMV